MSTNTTTSSRLGYLPGLDGLRAIAVGLVFLFHAGVIDGGFIGVDVFFVISGFLITALAVGEVERTGRLALGAFWARRARRLLPALFLVLVAVVLYSLAVGGSTLQNLGRDVVATVLYLANWAQLSEGRDYFAVYEAPSLLEHAWSLAVEEQFYIAWPLVIAAAAYLTRRRPQRIRLIIGILAGFAAVASVVTALVLRDDPTVSLTRLYYGTDTRSVGLAIGAIAGCLLRPAQIGWFKRRSVARDIVGVIAATAVLYMSYAVDGSERWLYGFGFLLIAILSLVVMLVAVAHGPIASFFAQPTLVSLGRVSYGIYLWHWPVIVALNADRTGLHGPALGVAWILATGLLTAASWYLVERPAPMPTRRRPLWSLTYLAIPAVVAGLAVSLSAQATEAELTAAYTVPTVATPAIPAPTPKPVPVLELPVDQSPDSEPDQVVPTDVDEPTVGNEDESESQVDPTPTPLASETVSTPPVDAAPIRLLIVGDSVAASLRSSDGVETMTITGFEQVDILNVAGISCPVIQEGSWWTEDGSGLWNDPSCDGHDRYDETMASFDPDVVFTLFGWPGLGGGQELADGSKVLPCDPEFGRVWLRDYRLMVERLSQTATVVISTVAPHGAIDVDPNGRVRCLNDLVAQIDAPTFGYQEWLCPEYDCSVSATLRPDNSHFSTNPQLLADVMAVIVTQVLQDARSSESADATS